MKKFCLVLILSFLIPAQAHAIKYQGELESNESVTFPEQGSTPASPPTGKKKVYVKSDGLHVLDSAGIDQFLNPFTLTDESKLDGIESGADVTDAINVEAAGAVMDSDIGEVEGFLRKTGAGTYEGLKSNLNAATDPGATDDSVAGYSVGSLWVNTTLDKVWQAVDVTASSAIWKDLSLATAVTLFTALTDTPPAITARAIVKANSAGTALEFGGPPGILIQRIHVVDGAVATGTGTIPEDDTIPQNTEGNEFITATITPMGTATILCIRVRIFVAVDAASSSMTMALFQNSVANALAVSSDLSNGVNTTIALDLEFFMVSGTTSPITFRIRAGSDSASTMTFNGASGVRKWGGKLASTITIWELLQ